MPTTPTSFRLSQKTSKQLNKAARDTGKSKSKIVEEVLAEHFAREVSRKESWQKKFDRLMALRCEGPGESQDALDARIREFRGS